MLTRMSVRVSTLLTVFALISGRGETFGGIGVDVVKVLPQVAVGVVGGLYYETMIVVANPGLDQIDIDVLIFEAAGLTFLVPQSKLSLGPGETRKLALSGPELRVGYANLHSKNNFIASAYITVKLTPGSAETISQVSVLAQPAMAKAVIPVFRKNRFSLPNDPDNTGIAVVNSQHAEQVIPVSLADASGSVLRGGTIRLKARARTAIFVSELFPDLPEAFNTGTLVIEGSVPFSFSATALYAIGDRLLNAAVEKVDVSKPYSVVFKGGAPISEIAAQYGFLITQPGTTTIGVRMTDEIARAVARDPRVEEVSPSSIAELGPP